jgi:hypothetical protein
MIRYATLAYGDDPAVFRRAAMLLVSLIAYAPAEARELVVVTDRPERFVWFGTLVEVEYIDEEKLAMWRGTPVISMRPKLEAARLLAPSSGALVLLDADTLASCDLQAFVDVLASGALFMHRREYALGRTRRRGNRRLWRSLRGRTFAGWRVGADDEMWNSGVLAVPAADRTRLDGALALYDALAAAGVDHFALEQLAEGIVLGRTGRLREAAPWFVHYWGNKRGYDAEIARRLADAFLDGGSVKDAAAALRERPIDLPPDVRSSRGEKLARWLSAPS